MEKTFVQVNGKSYDAITGRRIENVTAAAHKPVRKVTVLEQSVSVKSRGTEAKHPPSTRRTAAHSKRHAPQSAQTLMRRAVAQPARGLKKQLRVHHEIAHATQQTIAVKHNVSHVDAARLQRAQQIEKDQQVHRFHSPMHVPVTFAHVEVQTAPQNLLSNEPPAVPAPNPNNTPTDIFEQAIANATHYVDIAAHKKHFKHKARRHALAMTAGIAALVVLGGFLAYTNTPSLQARVAGVVAGVSTTMPNFKAAGFSYVDVTGHRERLVYTFRNELASYQLIEQQTNWNGSQMITQVSSVKANGEPNYTALTSGDTTIYIFSDRHATWVKHGTWYQVHGEQPLSDTQLIALAQYS